MSAPLIALSLRKRETVGCCHELVADHRRYHAIAAAARGFLHEQNLLPFLKFSWLVNRALWPVWAFLGAGLLVKLAVKAAVRRPR